MTEQFFARNSDPVTSHQAADLLNAMDLTSCEKLIQSLLTGNKYTDEQLVDEYQIIAELANPKLQRSPSAIRTMRVNMYRKGLLEVVGIGKTRSGNSARIWTAREL